MPFLGQIASSVLGLATESDVQAIRDHVNQLTVAEGKAINEFKMATQHFSSYMRLEDEKVNKLKQAIFEQTNELASISTSIVQTATLQNQVLNIFVKAVCSQLYTLLSFESLYFGLEELGEGTGENGETVLVLRCAFTDFGNLQKALEEKSITPISAELEWIPTTTVPVNDAQAEDVSKLIERLEQDEDVQKVFHNMG